MRKFLKFITIILIEWFRIDLKTFLGLLCLTDTLKLSESKYQAGFLMIIWGQNSLTFIIPIYSTIVEPFLSGRSGTPTVHILEKSVT